MTWNNVHIIGSYSSYVFDGVFSSFPLRFTKLNNHISRNCYYSKELWDVRNSVISCHYLGCRTETMSIISSSEPVFQWHPFLPFFLYQLYNLYRDVCKLWPWTKSGPLPVCILFHEGVSCVFKMALHDCFSYHNCRADYLLHRSKTKTLNYF